MREAEIEAKLTEWVKDRGGLSYKFVSPGNAGVPDRIIIMPGGRVWFVELKSDTGRLGVMQERQRARLSRAGANTYVLKGMDGLREFIRMITEKEVMPNEL